MPTERLPDQPTEHESLPSGHTPPQETTLPPQTMIVDSSSEIDHDHSEEPLGVVGAVDKRRGPKRIASYEILSEIGRGGMGVVYKAQDLRLKRTVALKVVLAGGHAGETELARFQIEAEAVARLHYPNFVQIYEVGSDEGLPFLALEYCSGGSLEDRVVASPMPADEAAQLVATLADAMDHAHRARVIHRDLKPANILFDEHGEPKITDFGLAKRVGEDDSHTKTVSVMGSLGYMSPEQASGHTRNATPAVDIYALGAILYRLLTGKTPFEGTSTADSLRLIINGVPVPIRRLRPACPRDLDTICLKCLEKSPVERYSTAADLAADLRRFLNGEPIAARTASPLEQLVNWARRNRLPTTIAISGIVMLAFLAGAMAWTTYRNYQVIERIQHRDMRVQELRAQINFYDEVLTNACSLAAVTGETRWVERYRRTLPDLDSAIDEAVTLVPEANADLKAVNAANTSLVQLEDQAFSLVLREHRAEAWRLLNGDEYVRNKREYAQGLASFSDRLKEHSESAIRSARREAMWFLIASICLGGLVFLILLVGTYSVFRILREKAALSAS